MEAIKNFLSRLFAPRVVVLRARGLTDQELLRSMAVPDDHPILQAFLALIDRARQEARTEAKAVIKNDREVVFALGGEHTLDNLENYLLSLRAEAMRQFEGKL